MERMWWHIERDNLLILAEVVKFCSGMAAMAI